MGTAELFGRHSERDDMSETYQVVCPQCAAVNRLPTGKPAASAKCGKCHNKLFAGKPAELDHIAFAKQVKKSDVPVLVDFWAAWCGPCKMMAPEFEKAAELLEPRVRLAKLNTEMSPEVAQMYQIRSIPLLILFQDGHEIARQAGAMSADQIQQWTRDHLPVEPV